MYEGRPDPSSARDSPAFLRSHDIRAPSCRVRVRSSGLPARPWYVRVHLSAAQERSSAYPCAYCVASVRPSDAPVRSARLSVHSAHLSVRPALVTVRPLRLPSTICLDPCRHKKSLVGSRHAQQLRNKESRKASRPEEAGPPALNAENTTAAVRSAGSKAQRESESRSELREGIALRDIVYERRSLESS